VSIVLFYVLFVSIVLFYVLFVSIVLFYVFVSIVLFYVLFVSIVLFYVFVSIVLFCVLFVSIVLFYVLFVCKCILYYCHWVSTQLQLNISYIKSKKIGVLSFIKLHCGLISGFPFYSFQWRGLRI